ncbi:LAME_0D03884g1_1 [Lachancea meyersii CBS 8951]|uniref:Pre-mRNA-splicing factor SYF1 n=1 Tax=Lachancea meyersii CBS 8951 TaxID=1266667 RepID=A0A1G4J7T6_9SACH|nr:LAME_0D03884g1_1 [Lachancea meyersii CBS 8951]
MNASITLFVTSQEDLAFEYELQSNNDDLVVWKRYLEHRKCAENPAALAWVYERCCYHVPDSDSMWLEYLTWRVSLLARVNPVIFVEEFVKCNQLFEKAMYVCHQNVDVWELYLRHCISQQNLGLIRKVLNEALRNVTLEHHIRMWTPVVEFVETLLQEHSEDHDHEPDLDSIIQQSLQGSSIEADPVPKDLWSSHLLARYFQVADEWEYVLRLVGLTGDYHVISKLYEEKIIRRKDVKPVHQSLFSYYELYLKAIERAGSHHQYLHAMTNCLEMFPDQSPRLVTTLSMYYMKIKDFSMARSVLQDSLASTATTKAFSHIYDFLVKFLEVYVSGCMHLAQQTETPEEQARLDHEISYNIELLEHMMETHPILLNDLKLRQNINDVGAWLDRVSLYTLAQEKLNVYTDALIKIDPERVEQSGILGKLWCGLSELYINTKQLDCARESFDRSTRVPYKFIQDLESVWYKWAEMEVNCGRSSEARKILETALTIPKSPELLVDKFYSQKGKVPVQAIIFTSMKLWSFYIDLLEASSCAAEVSKAYEHIIALKLATPLHFLNYVQFLQGQERWNESFKIYERALAIFPAAVSLEIWNLYLKDSLKRSRPVETMRDLFEQALLLAGSGIDCSSIFIQYSEFEQNQGMDKRCVDILARGSLETGEEASSLRLWALCLNKCKQLLGLESSRALYQKCIQTLPNPKVMPFVLDFAQVEETLSDVARARAVLHFGAQLAHPDSNVQLWARWNDLELRHGDKASYKEMLRIKRELSDTMKVSTEEVSKQDGNVEFVASKVGLNSKSEQPQPTQLNPAEISLDI